MMMQHKVARHADAARRAHLPGGKMQGSEAVVGFLERQINKSGERLQRRRSPAEYRRPHPTASRQSEAKKLRQGCQSQHEAGSP